MVLKKKAPAKKQVARKVAKKVWGGSEKSSTKACPPMKPPRRGWKK